MDLSNDRHKRFREKHGERLREMKRQKYQENREAILQKGRNDKQECPICKIEYRRLYLKRHLLSRHKFDEEIICQMIQPKVKEPHPPAIVQVQ